MAATKKSPSTKARASAKTSAMAQSGVSKPKLAARTAAEPAAKRAAKPVAKAAKKASGKTAKPSVRGTARVSPSKGKSFEWYAGTLSGWKRVALSRLHEIVRSAAPDASSTIKWGQPVFDSNGPFAWMKAFGKHVSIGFWRGAEMTDPAGALEGDGDRMRHLKFTSVEAIEPGVIQQFVRQALALNKAKGNPTLRG